MIKTFFLIFLLSWTNETLHAMVLSSTHTDQSSREIWLQTQALKDNVLWVQFALKEPVQTQKPTCSPYLAKKEFLGAKRLEKSAKGFETAELTYEVDEKSLCFLVSYSGESSPFVEICPTGLGSDWHGVNIRVFDKSYAYGLGQQFKEPGVMDGDWTAFKERSSGDDFGNQMVKFNGGSNGNTQFPILYVHGEKGKNFALFLDNVYQQRWDFTANPWQARMRGQDIRLFVIAGDSLKQLRSEYLDLVGRPLVPPRKMFGLWLSEYGYRNWQEVRAKFDTLNREKFPIDGFVMDLQWFGGIGDETAMGKLSWDLNNFPDPASNIAPLKSEGIGLMLIEESYVGKNLKGHEELAKRGLLVKDKSGEPLYIHDNSWWGKGGMLDWSNDETGSFWHDYKRQELIDKYYILGHWTDLGEPEIYDAENSVYHGFEPNLVHQSDVHNLYNLAWVKSIHDGYIKNSTRRRPFILSRSGGPGIQRYGATMWSADIGSRLSSLASHNNAQMHMSFSGVDYFGSDVGGFHGAALDGDAHELYTQWFANACWFDVPLRPHSYNLEKNIETSPAAMGDVPSNRANLMQRYDLIPYYYSLAHQAHRTGDALIAPMVYHFENDLSVSQMGSQKMIGPFLLIAAVAQHGQKTRSVYLPQGTWLNYHSGSIHKSQGAWLEDVPLQVDGLFRLPAYLKQGAIIPTMKTRKKDLLDWSGTYSPSAPPPLRVQVFPSTRASDFTIFEDDGVSSNYLSGDLSKIRVSQWLSSDLSRITISMDPCEGSMCSDRSIHFAILYADIEPKPKRVYVDCEELEMKEGKVGWHFDAKTNRLYISLGKRSAHTQHDIVIENQKT